MRLTHWLWWWESCITLALKWPPYQWQIIALQTFYHTLSLFAWYAPFHWLTLLQGMFSETVCLGYLNPKLISLAGYLKVCIRAFFNSPESWHNHPLRSCCSTNERCHNHGWPNCRGKWQAGSPGNLNIDVHVFWFTHAQSVLTHAWFFFEIIVKSMAEYLVSTKMSRYFWCYV